MAMLGTCTHSSAPVSEAQQHTSVRSTSTQDTAAQRHRLVDKTTSSSISVMPQNAVDIQTASNTAAGTLFTKTMA
jgi:ribosome maturation protein Sdo1